MLQVCAVIVALPSGGTDVPLALMFSVVNGTNTCEFFSLSSLDWAVRLCISYNTPGRDVTDVIISTTHEGAQRPSVECLYVGYIPPRGVISVHS